MKANCFFGQWVDVIEFEPFLGDDIDVYQKKIEEFFYEFVEDDDCEGEFIEQFKKNLPYTYLSGEAIVYWMKLVEPNCNARVVETHVIYGKEDESLPYICF